MKIRTMLKTGVASLVLAASTVSAHPMWMLPSEFSLSGEKSEWVTVDVSASHTYFGFDKGLPLDNVVIHSPDGDQNHLGSYFKGHRRSVFDVEIDQKGTYKLELKRPVFYMTLYKSGKRDAMKRLFGADKQQAKERLPKNARDVVAKKVIVTSQSFITSGAPTTTTTAPAAKGLAIELTTHPADVVTGEELSFRVLFDGKPQAGVEVEITPGGTKYRDDRKYTLIGTDSSGIVKYTPQQNGPHILGAYYTKKIDTPLADELLAMHYLTFESVAD